MKGVKFNFCFQLLDGMVEGGFITARSACDALLQNEKLHYTNTHIWSLTFVMLRKHIGTSNNCIF